MRAALKTAMPMEDARNKRIAVIGASDNPEKYGHKIFKSLLNAGFNVIGININGGETLGKKLYRSISDLDIIPDIVLTVVAPEITEKIVEECFLVGVKEIWMQPGSESDNAINKAKKLGIKTTSNACFMIEAKIW